ncbi:MAG TPA: PAS domain S-box protein, partial [Symbiobacteriaceae bacterium]|nr:PAS domain S-box protein [Symbiobacteriaceae bacterium]
FNLLFYNLKRSESALKGERNFIAGVLDTAGAPMFVLDLEGRIVRFNRTCQQITGYDASEVEGRYLWDRLLAPEEALAAREDFTAGVAANLGMALEHDWLTRTGERRLIAWSATPLLGEDGSVHHVVGAGADITERRQAELELKEREQRLRSMVESVQTGMLLIDRQTRAIVNANPAAAAMIGMPPESVVGRPCSEFLRCAVEDGACPLSSDTPVVGDPFLVTGSGKEIPVHRTVAAVESDGRELLVESIIDMTEHKRLEQELRQLSMVDELTGLYNRRGFMTLAEKEIEAAHRLRGTMALLYVDVSGLKEINDNWGNRQGDLTLVAMAQILREAFRESSLIGRTGGDEFVVLAPQFMGATPSLLVQRLNQYIESYNCAAGLPYEIRVSTGVARITPDRPYSIMELLTQADTNMYVEKRRRAMSW